jgi:hypothetical protein
VAGLQIGGPRNLVSTSKAGVEILLCKICVLMGYSENTVYFGGSLLL